MEFKPCRRIKPQVKQYHKLLPIQYFNVKQKFHSYKEKHTILEEFECIII